MTGLRAPQEMSIESEGVTVIAELAKRLKKSPGCEQITFCSESRIRRFLKKLIPVIVLPIQVGKGLEVSSPTTRSFQ
jgi:hypothetical protein